MYLQMMQLKWSTAEITQPELMQLSVKKGKQMGRRDREVHRLPNRHTKRCSALLVIREMQMKTIIRYQFVLIQNDLHHEVYK